MAKIGFIGAGNMAGAIINGVLKSGILKPSEIMVFDINTAQCQPFVERGCLLAKNAKAAVAECKYIILAVKPQNFPDVLDEISEAINPESVVISIAAGISISYLKSALGEEIKAVQVMPNTPMLLGYGAVAICRKPPVSDEEFAFAKQLFACAGAVEEIAPDKMNEIIALNGSSPAYIYLITKLFCEHAASLGIDYETANRLFCSSLIGSAHMMLETGKSHQELIDMVTSPNGTTYAGLQALDQANLKQAVTQCYDATTNRAYELGK